MKIISLLVSFAILFLAVESYSDVNIHCHVQLTLVIKFDDITVTFNPKSQDQPLILLKKHTHQCTGIYSF